MTQPGKAKKAKRYQCVAWSWYGEQDQCRRMVANRFHRCHQHLMPDQRKRLAARPTLRKLAGGAGVKA